MIVQTIEDLKKMPIEQIRRQVVEMGADWHPAEKKIDLAARLMQLQGTPEVADKLRMKLEKAGFAKEDKPIYTPQGRLTTEQMKKIVAPYLAQGLKFKVSKDGAHWSMAFDTGRTMKYDGEIMPVISKDSGSTTIPPKVLEQCAQLLIQTKKRPKVRKTQLDAEFGDEDSDEVAA